MKASMQKLNEQGVAAAEFALVLPVLLLLLFGTIEFGMMMYGREVVTNAAREGARAGIVQGPNKPTGPQVEQIADTYLTGTGINPDNVDFAADQAGDGFARPDMLTVAVEYRYFFLIPYIPAMVGIPDPLIINTSVVMMHE
jgi:hypothetical protein